MRRGFSQADIESTRLGRLKWNHAESIKVPAEQDVSALSARRTSRIKNAPSAEVLILVLDEVLDGPFDFYQASSAYTQLAALKRRRGLQTSDWDSPVIARLHARVEDLVLQDQLNEQASANILWSIATLSDQFSIPTQLLDVLVKSLPDKAEGMKPQELSNCLWAFVQLREVAPNVLEVVPAIGTQIMDKAEDMSPQQLSNSLWACAKLKEAAPNVLQIVPAISAKIPSKAKNMIPQELSNCLWAALLLKDDAPKVLEILPTVVAEVPIKIEDMKPQEMSNTLQALVPLNGLVPEISRLLADDDGEEDILRSAVARLSTLLPRLRGKDLGVAVPSVVWACAKLGMYHEELLLSVTEQLGCTKTLSRLPHFGLCALSWSYQVLAQDDFVGFKRLLRSETMRRGFSEADVESTRLGLLNWNHAQLKKSSPVRV
eukprot:Skav213009  [mRNA]  locus=scaffold2312:71456:72748:+ [translate_table: standard]